MIPAYATRQQGRLPAANRTQLSAFTGLQLAPFPPSGPSVSVRNPMRVFASAPQIQADQAWSITGFGTTAGAFFSHPLVESDKLLLK